jgi:AmmeMemoRadiSam system protein B/AmmeMemoRadiSam system protein A
MIPCRKVFLISIAAVLSCTVLSSCRAGNGDARLDGSVRPPAVAGAFYPGSKEQLEAQIQGFLKNAAKTERTGEVKAVWVPHAGTVYSGQTAAHAFAQARHSGPDVVVVLSSSHSAYLKGAAVCDWDAFRTPLGTVSVDRELAGKLCSRSSLVKLRPDIDREDHTIEVELPFIQILFPGTPLLPIMLGEIGESEIRSLSEALSQSLAGRKPLLVASSDMSHYPSHENASAVDAKMLEAVRSFDELAVWRLGSRVPGSIPNLNCTMCGFPALTAVMRTAKLLGADAAAVMPYATSGDVSGDRTRVVGYGSAVFYKKGAAMPEKKHLTEEIPFSAGELDKLFQIARLGILAALRGEPRPVFQVQEPRLLLKRGVFVTLTNRGRLRGCIGHFSPDLPLCQIVLEMAEAAATQDYRFAADPVTEQEMDRIDIKISVLSDLVRVQSPEEVEVGRHGIWIKHGRRGGTYLPEVAVEQGWTREEFIEHCCVEKAGLPPDALKRGAELYVYTSQILEEKR